MGSARGLPVRVLSGCCSRRVHCPVERVFNSVLIVYGDLFMMFFGALLQCPNPSLHQNLAPK